MSKKHRVAGNPSLDATLPYVALELNGESYRLAFDYAALSLAERKLADIGMQVNMLNALDLRSIGAERLPIVFYAALVKAHPEMTYEDAKALVSMRTYSAIFEKVVEAFIDSMKEEKGQTDANPLTESVE